MKTSVWSYFRSSIAVTVLGLIGGTVVGYIYSGTLAGALSALFLTAVLAVLEISLSFDNAVVNAKILNDMTPLWRKRFMTWGMLLAVFGMRIVFPLVVVSVAAAVSPWQALVMATAHPAEYAQVMLSAHLPLAGFGGAFLMMVALAFFFDHQKEEHWLRDVEILLTKIGRVESIHAAICLLLIYILSTMLHDVSERLTFLSSGIGGIITFLFVDGISAFLKIPTTDQRHLQRAGAAMFVYLEILDASFSFDGVVGAFALTSNLFIIAAGLGIGAMFVRSLTILLVEKRTLRQFQYLEHGAFYAIAALAVVMLLDVFIPVPEVVTGLIGAVIMAFSIWSSLRSRQD